MWWEHLNFKSQSTVHQPSLIHKKACKMQSDLLLITQFSRNKHFGMEIMTIKHAVSLQHLSLGKSNHFGTRISEIPMQQKNTHKQEVLGRTCGNFCTDCVWYNKRIVKTMN